MLSAQRVRKLAAVACNPSYVIFCRGKHSLNVPQFSLQGGLSAFILSNEILLPNFCHDSKTWCGGSTWVSLEFEIRITLSKIFPKSRSPFMLFRGAHKEEKVCKYIFFCRIQTCMQHFSSLPCLTSYPREALSSLYPNCGHVLGRVAGGLS